MGVRPCPQMKFFKQFRHLGVEVIYLTIAVAVGFAVLGYFTRTGAFNSIEGVPGVGTVARGFKALLYQTYNP